ncbi:ABATE domain-containing protein [Streptomyces sp. NPDC006172]|uniref:ABATE domain-containing protein n=1 Tax=Streptomyces sp. NPDC006172 TaxID=3154470 RepID=UPI0033E398DF
MRVFHAGRIRLDLLATTHPRERLDALPALCAWIGCSGLVPPGTPLAHADPSWPPAFRELRGHVGQLVRGWLVREAYDLALTRALARVNEAAVRAAGPGRRTHRPGAGGPPPQTHGAAVRPPPPPCRPLNSRSPQPERRSRQPSSFPRQLEDDSGTPRPCIRNRPTASSKHPQLRQPAALQETRAQLPCPICGVRDPVIEVISITPRLPLRQAGKRPHFARCGGVVKEEGWECAAMSPSS